MKRHRIDSHDIKDMKIFKYYRLVRKWACKSNNLSDGDLELLIYLDCKHRFTRKEFMDGVYTLAWDKDRWERLRREGWIAVWRQGNRKSQKYSIFRTSTKCQQLILRMYRILLGEEKLPTSERSVFYKNKSYTDKVMNKATNDMLNDPDW